MAVLACCVSGCFESFSPLLEEILPTVTDKMIKVHLLALMNRWVMLAVEERATRSIMLFSKVCHGVVQWCTYALTLLARRFSTNHGY